MALPPGLTERPISVPPEAMVILPPLITVAPTARPPRDTISAPPLDIVVADANAPADRVSMLPLERVSLRSMPPEKTITLPPRSTPLLERPKISTRLPELAVPPLSVAPGKMIAVATPVGSGPPWSTAAGPTSRMAPGLYVTEDGKAPLSSSAPPELMTVIPVVTPPVSRTSRPPDLTVVFAAVPSE